MSKLLYEMKAENI